MNKVDLLQKILTTYTPLKLDVDLFYLEMPLDKSGFWFEDSQTDNVRTERRQFDIYARYKSKASARANTAFFQSAIDNLDACKIDDELFKLRLLYSWNYTWARTRKAFYFH